MFLFVNLIEASADILGTLLDLYMLLIVIRAILSWVNPDPYNPIVRFLYRATEPVLRPVRRWLPFGNIGIDLSPVVVLLVIVFLKKFLIQSLVQFAGMLRS